MLSLSIVEVDTGRLARFELHAREEKKNRCAWFCEDVRSLSCDPATGIREKKNL